MCVEAIGKSHLSAYKPIHISKRCFLRWGRGARAQPSACCVHNPVHPTRRTHRMHARTRHFPKPPPQPRRGTRLPGLTPQTSPRKGRADLPTLSEGDTAWRDPLHSRPHRLRKALHTPGIHTLCKYFLRSQLPTWSLQTPPTVLGALSLRGHGPAGTSYQ